MKIKNHMKINSSLSLILKIIFYRKYNFMIKIFHKIDIFTFIVMLQLTTKLMNMLNYSITTYFIHSNKDHHSCCNPHLINQTCSKCLYWKQWEVPTSGVTRLSAIIDYRLCALIFQYRILT